MGLPTMPRRYYFGRQVALPCKGRVTHFALSNRKYIGPTSMDTEVSFVMCNIAKVKRGSVVFDPYAGESLA